MRAVPWLQFLQQNGWIIAVAALVVSIWSAWTSWRRDNSRFKIRVKRPPTYRPTDGIQVTAIYLGGPPLKVAAVRARVVRVDGIRWFEVKPATSDDSILRPENREVTLKLGAEYEKYFWYVETLGEAGLRRRRYLRICPRLWLPKLQLGVSTIAEVGGIAIPGRLEKSFKATVRELLKDAKRKA